MKTLQSSAVFGLVPIPPADTSVGGRNDLPIAGGEIDRLRRMFHCRPIVKRIATAEEIAPIRAELGEAEARARDLC